MTTEKLKLFLGGLLAKRIDVWFFYGFILTFPFTIRKVITFYPIRGAFNEYTGVYLYLSDLFLLAALGFWGVNILCNNWHNLSIFNYLWLKKSFLTKKWLFNENYLALTFLLLFLAWSLISISWSSNRIITLFRFLKLLEFFFLYLYIKENIFNFSFRKSLFHVEQKKEIYNQNSSTKNNYNWFESFSPIKTFFSIFIIISLFNALLAFLQFANNGSIGLYFLRESLLAPDMLGVAKINILEHTNIRPYAFFPHPNILGAYLLVSLIMTFIYRKCFIKRKNSADTNSCNLDQAENKVGYFNNKQFFPISIVPRETITGYPQAGGQDQGLSQYNNLLTFTENSFLKILKITKQAFKAVVENLYKQLFHAKAYFLDKIRQQRLSNVPRGTKSRLFLLLAFLAFFCLFALYKPLLIFLEKAFGGLDKVYLLPKWLFEELEIVNSIFIYFNENFAKIILLAIITISIFFVFSAVKHFNFNIFRFFFNNSKDGLLSVNTYPEIGLDQYKSIFSLNSKPKEPFLAKSINKTTRNAQINKLTYINFNSLYLKFQNSIISRGTYRQEKSFLSNLKNYFDFKFFIGKIGFSKKLPNLFHEEQFKQKISFFQSFSFLNTLFSILTVFLLFTLFLTFSKNSILGLFMVFFAIQYQIYLYENRCFGLNLAYTKQFFYKKILLRKNLLILAIFLMLIINIHPSFDSLIFNSLSDRIIFQNVSRETIFENPILGVGIGQFVNSMDLYSKMPLLNWQFQPVHNVFSLIWSELGIIGLLLFLGFTLATLNSFRLNCTDNMNLNYFKICFRGLFIAFLLMMLFDHYFWDIQQGSVLFWIVLAFV